jgi:hypothetical protein
MESIGWIDDCLLVPEVQSDSHAAFEQLVQLRGGRVMWMRSCAVCKALLKKLRLCDSVRCQCGWEW